MDESNELVAHHFWSSERAAKLRRQIRSRVRLGLYMLGTLPAGLFAGIRVETVDSTQCITSVPYRWRTRNPFGSTYFAVLAMAAELSSGAPAMIAVHGAPESVALIIIGLEAEFVKAARGRTTFTCSDVPKLNAAIEEAIRTGEAVSTTVSAEGRNPDGEVVARFNFTWSFKKRSTV